MEFQDIICILLYMAASVFFIMGIKKLGRADTARQGNLMSSIGMAIAVISVLISQDVIEGGLVGYGIIIVAIIAGSVIGFIWARKVEMTGMPQLVALFNGFGGLSSMLVAISQFCALRGGSDKIATDAFTSITLGLTILIGAVAFTGSLIAWGKLAGLKMFKKPITIPAKNVINAAIGVIAIVGIILYTIAPEDGLGLAGILITTIASLALGITMVIT
ncbi:MAG: NAD(P)(+) transhydrogenase (Re/Si-specific) subunit beta, partial [Saccharofermentans sp.]|nr:NAD(P)(+) transhydrogenase (Re/Si-specific) subunit beta [Saccharofermentans sp.]